MINRSICLVLGVVLAGLGARAEEYQLVSPGGKAKMVVNVDRKDGITATCFFQDKEMVKFGPVALETDQGKVFGKNPVVRKVSHRSADEVITPPVRQKRQTIRDNYNEMEILFKDPFRLIFRAYDDGVAYRFKTDSEGEMIIKAEQAAFNFPADDYMFMPTDVSMFTHSERSYQHIKISWATVDTLSSTPFLVDREDGISVLITESDLEDYPGLYVYGTGGKPCSSNIRHMCLPRSFSGTGM